MVLRRLWYLLFGPPRVKHCADGGLRVRIGGEVFAAADEDALIRSIDRARTRTVERLAQLRLSASVGSGYGYGLRGPGTNLAFRQARTLEHRLRLYEGFLASLLRES
jgi:hypothetical protein